jgi:hypothetical protein
MTIIISRHGSWWQAEIKTPYTHLRGTGATAKEAIGDLIFGFPASCDVIIQDECPAPLDGLAPENASEPAPGLAKARRRHEPITTSDPFLAECEHMASEWEGG